MNQEQIVAQRTKFSPKVGDRVTFAIAALGDVLHGVGEVVKLNRRSVEIEEASSKVCVDRAFLTSVVDPTSFVILQDD